MTDSNINDIQDIALYLKRHEEKDMLRFVVAGSVDDGKSTLIGRLLYDTKMIYEDQLAAVMADSKKYSSTSAEFDPALITDGLKAEREQGITIDVAYRYFSTDKRSFIICDAPGHEQYTRNMATGASHCDLAIILVDATRGVLAQTKRHSFICSLLGIRHLVVVINKMDAVEYNEGVYEKIRRDYEAFAGRLEVSDIHFIPVSALYGDNVVERSDNIPWYKGASLLGYLEDVTVVTDRNLIDFRFPVQYVLRREEGGRSYAGTVASGVIRKGDPIVVLPSGVRTRIAKIQQFEKELDEAHAPQAVVISTETEVDISRGNMLCRPGNVAETGNRFEAMLVWMAETELKPGKTYMLKSNTQSMPAVVKQVEYRIEVNTMSREKADGDNGLGLHLNEIGRVHITTHRALCFDPYGRNRKTGSFILIDDLTNETVAAGMILQQSAETHRDREKGRAPVSKNITWSISDVSRELRAKLMGHQAATLWLTGLSGSGKSTIGKALEKTLIDQDIKAYVLDGDNIRHGLNSNLGFSPEDRSENIRRIAEVAKLMNDAGLLVITSFISPYRADRAQAREIIGDDHFMEVFIDTPLEVCEQRDPKGLYKKARSGEIQGFTGIDAPYEAPLKPEITLPTAEMSPDEAVETVLKALQDRLQ